MKNIKLPPLYGQPNAPRLPATRHVTLVGGSGAGKSRFMDELKATVGERARDVSAIDDSFPAIPSAHLPSFVGKIREEALADSPLFGLISSEWQTLFPGNEIVRTEDSILFRTPAGSDLIEFSRLSRGESAGLYYLASVLSSPRRSVIFVDSPTLFLHPTVVGPLWNSLERLRPDCRFVYDTTDPGFVGSRSQNIVIWIKAFHSEDSTWEYELLPATDAGRVSVDLIGSRRPVLFIEGDAEHSIDSRLYSLVFPDYTVRPLGSCDKVIETTRTFSFLKQYHPLDTIGIVDRDRRSDAEVEYLRRRAVMVAEVAEVENIFLAEPVIRVMALAGGLDPDRTFRRVSEIVLDLFIDQYESQALQHTRYQVKRDVERKIDARFTCITALELHIKGLIHTLNPREKYNLLIRQFEGYIRRRDHAGILKVFNYKPMLTATAIPRTLGFGNAEEYIAGVLTTIKSDPVNGPKLREAVLSLFPLSSEEDKKHPRPGNKQSSTSSKTSIHKKSKHREHQRRYK